MPGIESVLKRIGNFLNGTLDGILDWYDTSTRIGRAQIERYRQRFTRYMITNEAELQEQYGALVTNLKNRLSYSPLETNERREHLEELASLDTDLFSFYIHAAEFPDFFSPARVNEITGLLEQVSNYILTYKRAFNDPARKYERNRSQQFLNNLRTAIRVAKITKEVESAQQRLTPQYANGT